MYSSSVLIHTNLPTMAAVVKKGMSVSILHYHHRNLALGEIVSMCLQFLVFKWTENANFAFQKLSQYLLNPSTTYAILKCIQYGGLDTIHTKNQECYATTLQCLSIVNCRNQKNCIVFSVIECEIFHSKRYELENFFCERKLRNFRRKLSEKMSYCSN